MKRFGWVTGLIILSLSVIGQNWETIGGSSLHNGLSSSYGPESVTTPVWSITNASSTMWGGAIYTSGDLFATSRVKFSPAYHVTLECRKISDGSLVWEKSFPNDGKLYIVGMNEDAVYVHNYATDSLFAFERQTGSIKWVCPEKAMIFGGAHGILFACNGDPVANGPDTYEKSLMRLDKKTGQPLWFNTNMNSVSPAPDYCIAGDKLYRWEGAIGIPTHLVAVDLESGDNLFYSEDLAGDPDQEHPLIAGPDGTIYGQRDGGDLWAFTDEGSSFSVKWFYSPENGGMGTYGNIGVGPDRSVYYPDGNVVRRLNPDNGQVMNTSEALCTAAMYGTYITIDDNGTVYICNGEDSEGKYFAFSADLQTKYWEKAVPYCYYAGPQISEEGIFIMSGSGTKIDAFKTSQSHGSVSWFEATDTEIPQYSSVEFNDRSSFDPTYWHWLFPGGDPSESGLQDPEPIVYSLPGSYPVILITANGNGADTVIRECYIRVDETTAIDPVEQEWSIEIYPNPSPGSFTVSLPESADYQNEYEILDILGRMRSKGNFRKRVNEMDPGLESGIYFLRIKQSGNLLTEKLIIR